MMFVVVVVAVLLGVVNAQVPYEDFDCTFKFKRKNEKSKKMFLLTVEIRSRHCTTVLRNAQHSVQLRHRPLHHRMRRLRRTLWPQQLGRQRRRTRRVPHTDGRLHGADCDGCDGQLCRCWHQWVQCPVRRRHARCGRRRPLGPLFPRQGFDAFAVDCRCWWWWRVEICSHMRCCLCQRRQPSHQRRAADSQRRLGLRVVQRRRRLFWHWWA